MWVLLSRVLLVEFLDSVFSSPNFPKESYTSLVAGVLAIPKPRPVESFIQSIVVLFPDGAATARGRELEDNLQKLVLPRGS